jgi:hypothetical protein
LVASFCLEDLGWRGALVTALRGTRNLMAAGGTLDEKRYANNLKAAV